VISLVPSLVEAQKFNFPHQRNYGPHVIKPDNFSQSQMNQDVRDAYNWWKNLRLTSSGTPGPNMLRVQKHPGDNRETVSEGMGYGALFAVFMVDRPTLDKLFRYYNYYKRRPFQANIADSNGLMAWRINSSGQIVDPNPATDGDIDMAYALIMAHRNWGSGGAVDYRAEGLKIIRCLENYYIESGTNILLPGNFGGSNCHNPGYYAPAWFKVFKEASGNPIWDDVTRRLYDTMYFFYQNYNTGLVPDWCTVNNQTVTAYPNRQYTFGYDAYRAPLRTAHNFALHEETAPGNGWLARWNNYRLSRWASNTTGFNASNLKGFYNLNGSLIGGNNNSAAVAAFTVAAMANTDRQPWLNNLYAKLRGMDNSGNDSNYFTSCMRMWGMLIVTGNMPEFY
jgi:endo-1,4-beta-D-glucanase Y